MTMLTDNEQRRAATLISKGATYIVVDRRDGAVEPMRRNEALRFAKRALEGPLAGVWRELEGPAHWVKSAFDAWALVVDDDGWRLSLVGVGRHAQQAPS